MRKIIVALVVALLLPVCASAQTPPAEPAPPASFLAGYGKAIIITTGVIGGLLVADLVTGGSLTGPLLTAVGLRAAPPVMAGRPPLSAALLEARAAGVVLGEQITGATYARDEAARRDILYVTVLGIGALAGGYLVSQFTN